MKAKSSVNALDEQRRTRTLTMLLAADIGGTKTLLGLFDPGGARPHPCLLYTSDAADE